MIQDPYCGLREILKNDTRLYLFDTSAFGKSYFFPRNKLNELLMGIDTTSERKVSEIERWHVRIRDLMANYPNFFVTVGVIEELRGYLTISRNRAEHSGWARRQHDSILQILQILGTNRNTLTIQPSEFFTIEEDVDPLRSYIRDIFREDNPEMKELSATDAELLATAIYSRMRPGWEDSKPADIITGDFGILLAAESFYRRLPGLDTIGNRERSRVRRKCFRVYGRKKMHNYEAFFDSKERGYGPGFQELVRNT